MNIHLLTGTLNRQAGSHAYNLDLANKLHKAGHEVTVICYATSEELDPDITTITLQPPNNSIFPLTWRIGPYFRYWDLTKQLWALETHPPECVITLEHLTFPAYRRKFPNIPFLYVPHSYTVPAEIQSYRLPFGLHHVTLHLYKSIQRKALRQCEATMRFTKAGCRALRGIYGPLAKNLIVNPAPIDIPDRVSLAPPVPARFLSVGRLIESKRIDIALRALQSLPNRDWHFDIVGDGPERTRLAQLACELGLSKNTTFHGFQSSDPFYRSASLCLFPSTLESTGLVLLESMSHGIPCIAMKPDGIKILGAADEFIVHEANGFLAESDQDFSSILQRWHSLDLNTQQLMRNRARNHVSSHNTWQSHLARLTELLERLVHPDNITLIPNPVA